MEVVGVVLLVLLAPFAIYVLARLISTAYFSAKFDHIKKVMRHDDPTDSNKDDRPLH